MSWKKLSGYIFHRTVLVSLIMVLQVALLVVMILRFSDYFVEFYLFCLLLSLLVVLYVMGSHGEPRYKIAWIVPILLEPLFGGLVYLLCGGSGLTRKARAQMEAMDRRLTEALGPDRKAEALEAYGMDAVNQSRYMEDYAHCPLYTNSETRYFPLGDDVFEPMLEELRRAEKYIFLEYFIIHPGKFWDSILDILEEKVQQGVEVRVIYDDVGCLYTLPKNYDKVLEEKGIACQVFNRFVPVLSVRLNNRDHRKFCIVDGKTAFTGGINLADEYINEVVRYGHWKDSAIQVTGEAAWSMTVTFLAMWEYISGGREDFENYRPRPHDFPRQAEPQWVQPYVDSPLDGEPVGETVYLNLISRAKRYVYIMTPYLIISDSVTTALCVAAKSGVDVRILTPHIPDKKTVFEVTRAHYGPLLEAGVRIFEYTPGFLHAKNFAVDDLYATVGSINMDYRSMFLHFEDGVWLCGGPTVAAVRDDFLATQERSVEVERRWVENLSLPRRILRSILKTFAPLM